MTDLFTFLPLMVLSSLLLVGGVYIATRKTKRIPVIPTTIATALGGAPYIFLLRSVTAETLVLAFFASLLAGAAWLDREYAWAPDLSMGMLTGLAVTTGGILGSWQYPLYILMLIGIGLYIASQLVWVAIVQILIWLGIIPDDGPLTIPPPADLLALCFPFLVFGISMTSSALLGLNAIIVFACLKNERFYSLFSRRAVVSSVYGELGRAGGDEVDESAAPPNAITFLAVALPVVWIAVFAQLLSARI